jgi:hypothetical protein
MRKSIVLFVLASIMAAFAAGCGATMPNTAFAFEPRSYPYIPELGGPDSPENSANAHGTAK